MGSACPEWTVASSDPLFIGMQNNGQWLVIWGGGWGGGMGVVGTDLVVDMIIITTICFTMKVNQKCDEGKFFFDICFMKI